MSQHLRRRYSENASKPPREPARNMIWSWGYGDDGWWTGWGERCGGTSAGLIGIDGNGGAAVRRGGDRVQSGAGRRAAGDRQTGSSRRRAAGSREAAKDASGATLLDKITVVSRTGETAIETLASVSHIDQEQLDRRMATTPLDIFFGVPGIALQSDAKRAALKRQHPRPAGFRPRRGDRRRRQAGFPALGPRHAKHVLDRSGTGEGGRRAARAGRQHLRLRRHRRRGGVRDQGRGGFPAAGRDLGGLDQGPVTRPTAMAGRPAPPAPTGSTMRSTCSAISSGATTATTRTGDGDEVGGTGFDVLSGMLKASVRPTENSELKLGWVGAYDSWTEGTDSYDLDLDQNTFTGRYNITDDEQSWLDLHINGSLNKADLDQTYLKDVMQFDSQTGHLITIPAGSHTTYDLDTYGLDIWNTSRFETGAAAHELTYGGDWVSDDVVTAERRRRQRRLHAVGRAQGVGRLHPGEAHLGMAAGDRRPALRQLQAQRRRGRQLRRPAVAAHHRRRLAVQPGFARGAAVLRHLCRGLPLAVGHGNADQRAASGRRHLPVPAQSRPQAGDRQDLGIRRQLQPSTGSPPATTACG